MSNRGRQERGFGAPRRVVPETDAYLDHRHHDAQAPEPRNKLIPNVFQPAAVTVLAACIAWPLARVVAPFILTGTPDALSGVPFLWGTVILLTFIGFRTQRVVSRRYLSGSDANRARLTELAVLFLVVKLFHHLDDTVPELLEAMRGWIAAPLSFFDSESTVAYLLGVVGWLAASLTARDLDELAAPVPSGATSDGEESDPRRRIINRYFAGAAALLLFTALDRVSITSLVRMTNERIRAPIGHVLLYFLLGILLLGQVHWLRLTAIWERQKVTVSSNLASIWLRYALVFVALVALLAFLMPTGYTVGLLDLVRMAVLLITYLLTLFYLLIAWPFTWLFRLLLGNTEAVTQPEIVPPNIEPVAPEAGAGIGPWWDVVRSILFWIALFAVVIVLVRNYLRDRPRLMQRLRHMKPRQTWPLRWVERVWQKLHEWWLALTHTLPSVLPSLGRRMRRRAPRGERSPKHIRGLNAREQILHTYLTTLERIREWGVGRRQTETPYEYRGTLVPKLEEGQEAMNRLTEAFVAARYSTRTFTAEEAEIQGANAAEVLSHLHAKDSARQVTPPQEEVAGKEGTKSP